MTAGEITALLAEYRENKKRTAEIRLRMVKAMCDMGVPQADAMKLGPDFFSGYLTALGCWPSIWDEQEAA